MRIPDTKIDEIRSASDIVDIVSSYVRLRKRGKNFIGLCPFHQEKTPSFNVSPDKQMYYCFGCGNGGALAVEDRDRSALEPQHLLHLEEDRPDDLAQFKTAFQRVGDVEKQIQFIHHPTTPGRRHAASPRIQPPHLR